MLASYLLLYYSKGGSVKKFVQFDLMNLKEKECHFLLLTDRGNRDSMTSKQKFLKTWKRTAGFLKKPLRERASPAESACGG